MNAHLAYVIFRYKGGKMNRILNYFKQKLDDLVYPVKVFFYGDPSRVIEDGDDELAMGMGLVGERERKQLIAARQAEKLKQKEIK